jgi:hypothetical protein
MGTRHVTAVFQTSQPKIAQYGQWDGYPDGQGSNILEFLRKSKIDKFKEQVAKCNFISPEEVKRRWVECGADPNSEWVGIDIAAKFKSKYPGLSRDTGSDILNMVYKGETYELQNSLDFVNDSLWCEWAYVIDLDKNTFEVYEGFNQKPLDENERFFNDGALTVKNTGSYYPVRLIKSYPLDDLPTKAKFVKEIEKLTQREEEEEDNQDNNRDT